MRRGLLNAEQVPLVRVGSLGGQETWGAWEEPGDR